MDSIHLWILVCAGGIITLLGFFLAISEKELRKRRREITSLTAKLNQGASSNLLEQAFDKDQLLKLEKRNKELLEQVSGLSTRLEATEREFAEWEAERWRLKKIDLEKRELEAMTRKLGDEVNELRERVQADATLENRWQFQKGALEDQIEGLSSELKSTTVRLEHSQDRIRELENLTGAGTGDTAERSSQAWRTELEAQITALQRELAEGREKLRAFDAVNRQLLDLEQLHENLRREHQRLKDEFAGRQHQLADGECTQRSFGLVEPHAIELKTRAARVGQDDAQLLPGRDIVPVIQSHLPPASMFAGPTQSEETAAPSSHEQLGRSEPILLPAVLPSPDNRDTGNKQEASAESGRGYAQDDPQLSEILNTPDLNAYERRLVSQTFLSMAEAAHSRGQTDEMLRYRRLASRIVEPVPATNDESSAPLGAGNKDGEAVLQDRAEGSMAPALGSTANGAQEHERALSIAPPANIKNPVRKLVPCISLAAAVLLLSKILFNGVVKDPDLPGQLSAVPANSSSMKKDNESSKAPTAQNEPPPSKTHGSGENRLRTRPANENVTAPADGATKSAALRTPRSFDTSAATAANRPAMVWGAYAIVRETTVYSEPSENSAYISALSVGSQVNVVAARNGWYEIRSKDGSPSGFIRSHAASRLR